MNQKTNTDNNKITISYKFYICNVLLMIIKLTVVIEHKHNER